MAVSDAQLEALIKSLEKLVASQEGGSAASSGGTGGLASSADRGTDDDLTYWNRVRKAAKSAREEMKLAAMRKQQQKLSRRVEKGKRADMVGVQELDSFATAALVRNQMDKSMYLTAPERKALANILTGAFQPVSRLWKAGTVRSPICPWCPTGEEEA